MSKYRKEAKSGRVKSYAPAIRNRLLAQELDVMDKELQMFNNGEYIDTRAWLISKGALNKYGAVVINSFTSAVYDNRGQCVAPIDCSPILYEQLSADLEQWAEMRARGNNNFLRKMLEYKGYIKTFPWYSN